MENKLYCNQRGSALTLAMFAVIGLAAISYIAIKSKRDLSKVEVKEVASRDIDEALAKITTLFISASHCNANLSNQPQANSNFTSLRFCSSGSTCYGGSGPYDTLNTIPIFNEAVVDNPDQWGDKVTKLGDRVRLVGASYSIVQNQLRGVTTKRPATVEVTVRFQLNLGDKKNMASSGAHLTASQAKAAGITDYIIKDVKIVEKKVTAYAVTHLFNPSTSAFTIHPSSRFYGCSRAAASTLPYGM